MKTPKPKTVSVVCDVCGLDWKQHKLDAKGKVGLDQCVRLLKAECDQLRTRAYFWTGTNITSPTVTYAPGIPLN